MGSLKKFPNVYESVDVRSLAILGYVSKIDEKVNSGHKGLTLP